MHKAVRPAVVASGLLAAGGEANGAAELTGGKTRLGQCSRMTPERQPPLTRNFSPGHGGSGGLGSRHSTDSDQGGGAMGWGVIPSIRVRDMAEALAFYIGQLEFTLDSGGESATNSSLTRGDGRVMIETAADFYSDQYNEAIRERLARDRRSRSTSRPRILPLCIPDWKPQGRPDRRSARSKTLGSGRVHRRGS